MRPLLLIMCLALATPVLAQTDTDATCKQFDSLVARTYNFNASDTHLTEAQIQNRERQLDQFWTLVTSDKTKFLPCLRQKVADPKANPFFRFDGSNLLVTLDPSLDSKRSQVAVYTDTPLPLGVIVTERWVATLVQRGTEGFDVSKAAKRALDDKTVSYTPSNIIPEYADESLSHTQAAVFLWGSQSEERATPQLFALANDPKYPQRQSALFLLLSQATPQAQMALQKINRTGLSKDTLNDLDRFLKAPPLKARAKPKITRARFLSAFSDILAGKASSFFALNKAVPDNELDAAAVLLPGDLPLIRRVRRRCLLDCNRYSLELYSTVTNIIWAITAKDKAAQKA